MFGVSAGLGDARSIASSTGAFGLSWGEMRVLIVDGEPRSRSALADVLAKRKDIEAVDSVDGAPQALGRLQKDTYDILMLDIPAPETAGIELLDYLKKQQHPMPAVIFITEHRPGPLAAFEKCTIDYVLKPYSNERIHEALNILMCRSINERAAIFLSELMPQLAALVSKSAKIAIKIDGRILFVDPTELVAVEAQGNYALLVRRSGSYLVRESISAVADKLQPYGFIRIHRSILVNTSFVQGIYTKVTGEYLLSTTGGKEYPVSQTYRRNIGSLAHRWIGSDTLLAG
jgi:two-component system LytT family response regulator